ncbi:uncharacterized protein LOC142232835 [Haematobia irritans]|uniref:uncharacterized protein LOC142232835 n=1 Tax=Haematobia irritans TaxID=7368 RepID=UPI003F4FEC1C
MASNMVCRLCLTNAKDYLKLYDSNGHGNELFYLTMEYFHPKFVDMDKGKDIDTICSYCHQKIWDFHNYQEFVKNAQLMLNKFCDRMPIKMETNDDYNVYMDNMEAKGCKSNLKEIANEMTDGYRALKMENIDTENGYIDEDNMDHAKSSENSQAITVANRNSTTTEPCTTKNTRRITAGEQFEIREIPSDVDYNSEDEEDPARKDTKLDFLLALWMPNIKCIKCPESYGKFKDLRKHFIESHPDNEFYIVCCSRRLKKHQKIVEHMILHNNPDAFKCKTCGAIFSSNHVLRAHLIEKHQLHMKYKCETCSKSFEDEVGLKMHTILAHEVHMRMKPDIKTDEDGNTVYVCQQCGKVSKTAKIFRSHRYNAHQSKPDRTCVTCGKLFRTNRQLQEHASIHETQSVKARECDKKVSTKECSKTLPLKSRVKVKIERNDEEDNVDMGASVSSSKSIAQEHISLKLEKPESDADSDGDPNTPRRETRNFYLGIKTEDNEILDRQATSGNSPKMKSSSYDNEESSSYPLEDSETNAAVEQFEIREINSDVEYDSADDDEDDDDDDDAAFVQQPYDDATRDHVDTKLDFLLSMWMPNIKCIQCPESYPKLRELKKHFVESHPGHEFYILCCSRRLKKHQQIIEHMILHNNPNAFKCRTCGETFTSNHTLRSHMIDRHQLHMKYKCETCVKSFEYEIGLKMHTILAHEVNMRMKPDIQTNEDGITVYICRQCGKVSKSATLFRNHRYIVHQRKPDRKCETCGKLFKTNRHLQEHSSIHSKNAKTGASLEQFPCPHCGKIFYSQPKLKAHKWRMHPATPRYYCNVCDKALSTPRRYREHVAAHEKRDLYACVYCPMSFPTSSGIMHHRKTKHPTESVKNYYREIVYDTPTTSSIKTEEVTFSSDDFPDESNQS